LYQQQQQQQEEEEQDAENPFLDPPFSRIKSLIKFTLYHQGRVIPFCSVKAYLKNNLYASLLCVGVPAPSKLCNCNTQLVPFRRKGMKRIQTGDNLAI
jgi:hypothetical protein